MKPGTIIILAGAPGVGKSSLSSALQAVLAAPAIQLDFAQWLDRQIEHALIHGLTNGCIEAAVQAALPDIISDWRNCPPLIAAMQQTVAALARAGHSVIADLVLVDQRTLHTGALLFSALPALLVGVQSPVEVGAGSVQAPVQAVPICDPGVYDLTVDLALLTPHQGALQIQACLQAGPPAAWRWLKVWSDPAKHRGWLRQATTALTAPMPTE